MEKVKLGGAFFPALAGVSTGKYRFSSEIFL